MTKARVGLLAVVVPLALVVGAFAAAIGPAGVDYEANIRAVGAPCAVLVGAQDELFRSASFEPVFREAGKDWPVKIVPGVGHIGLTLDPRAVAAAVAMVEALPVGPRQ